MSTSSNRFFNHDYTDKLASAVKLNTVYAVIFPHGIVEIICPVIILFTYTITMHCMKMFDQGPT